MKLNEALELSKMSPVKMAERKYKSNGLSYCVIVTSVTYPRGTTAISDQNGKGKVRPANHNELMIDGIDTWEPVHELEGMKVKAN